MIPKKLFKTDIVALLLLVGSACGYTHAAPRAERQQKMIKSITLQSLNIMTIRPNEIAVGERNQARAYTRTIKDVCARINKHAHHNVIDKTVYDGERPFRIISGVVPVDDEVIFVYAGGWAGWPGRAHFRIDGQGLYSAYVNQKAGIMPGVCVNFDFPTHRASAATFGQLPDQQCLRLVLEEVQRVNPQASIVLVGSCIGAMTILNFIAQCPQELHAVKAIILESPSISVEHLEKHVMTSYLGAFGKKCWRFFKHYFRSYDSHMQTILSSAQYVSHELPILIGALVGDKVASCSDIQKIVEVFHETGHTGVELCVTDEPFIHGDLGKTKSWPKAVNAFLQKHQLPHIKELVA